MATSLKDALERINIPLSEEEVQKEEEVLRNKHRSKNVLERPMKKVELHSILLDDFEPRKEQRDPTSDLVMLPRVVTELARELFDVDCEETSYIIYCSWTEDTWYAPTKLCLDRNFIYRDDIEIYEAFGAEDAYQKAVELTKDLYPGVITPKVCYLLDDPANETYEVYHDASFPKIKYGKSTPDGMFISKYRNRFHRDMHIMELDKLYSEQSSRKAGKLMVKGYKADEAIIISDGCWLRNSCSASFIYLDNTDVVQFTKGFLPTDETQGVLIAEITGAKEAINYAVSRGKKKITYYYDNTSIINVFRNRRMEYLDEIKEYKSILMDIDKNTDIEITFVDIHPKTDEDRQDENRALMYFHNMCDAQCRRMNDIFKKDYRAIASNGGKNGDSTGEVMSKFKQKSKVGQPSGKRPQNNSRNGNNKYGRRS